MIMIRNYVSSFRKAHRFSVYFGRKPVSISITSLSILFDEMEDGFQRSSFIYIFLLTPRHLYIFMLPLQGNRGFQEVFL